MNGSRLLNCCTRVARAALPQDCLLCGAASDDAPLCGPCQDELPTLPRACPLCAMPSSLGEICGTCLRRPPQFDMTVAAWRYAYPVDRLVQALKFHGRLALASFFADVLASTRAAGRCGDTHAATPCASDRARIQPGGRDRSPLDGKTGDRACIPRCKPHSPYTASGGPSLGRALAQCARRVCLRPRPDRRARRRGG